MTEQYMQLAHAAYTVTNADTEAVAANAAREYLLLINDSDTDIYVTFSIAATTAIGIRINSGGGSYEMSRRNGNMDARAVRAIAGTTGKRLLITEG